MLKVRGLKELNQKVKRMHSTSGSHWFRATRKATLFVHSQIPPYPPPPVGSDYVRTGTLGRSITTEVKPLGGGAVGKIGTGVVYAPWVISERRVAGAGPQARVHRGRWYTLQGVMRKARAGVLKIYGQAIKVWMR